MKQRIVTGVVAGTFFILIIIIGGVPFTILTTLLALIAIAELLRMKQIAYHSILGMIAFLFTALVVIPDQLFYQLFSHSITKTTGVLGMFLLLLVVTVVSKNHYHFENAAFIFMSSLYAGIGFYFLHATRILSEGLPLLLFILLLIWATDSGAYFFGRSFGKRKLWPEISPNKTIEGALGGILSAIIIAVLFHWFYPLYSISVAILIAIVASVFGQMGDLVESALKRHYAVKDSGQLLPGHGGILDRFDSLIFVLPILHLFQLV